MDHTDLSDPLVALEKLLDILDTVERPGDYVASGSLESVTPRIDIEGIGPLSFPLPESQAKQLVAIAERAPYGKGGETLRDESVRKVWQIPATKVTAGERWKKTVEGIMRAARVGLGVEGEIRAELYKLLVYDAGSFFLPHRDTEKQDGMFATLVVVLPSVHEGGQLVVRHGGRESTLSLGGGELAEVSWAAFYADCVHELLPVTSGYRLALVYNLVRDAGSLSAPNYDSQAEQAVHVLEAWKDNLERWPTKIALALEHHYTLAGLSFAGLKGAEAGMASVLVEAAQRAGFSALLAMISITESGSAEENQFYGHRRGRQREYDDDNFEVIEVHERSVALEGFITPDDEDAGLGPIPLDEEEIFPGDTLEDEEPDEQHYHEATGNEGASFERTYRRAALVLWPESRRLAVLAQVGAVSVVPLLEKLVERSPADARELAVHLVDNWADDWAFRKHNTVARMLSALAALGMADVIERFARSELHEVYDGAQNDALLAACRAMTPERAVALLVELMSRVRLKTLAAAAALLEAFVQQSGAAKAKPAALALAERLPTDPALLERDRWDHPRTNPGFVAAVLRALWAQGDAEIAAGAVEKLLKWYEMDIALVPAALSLVERAKGAPGWAALRSAVVEHLSRRAALPLEKPADLTRPASWDCSCEDCSALNAFLRSPTEGRWSLKASKDRRAHVESQIARAQLDVDTETVTRGSPHTLVCTKNTRSYEARVAQRQQDLAALAVLG